MIIGVLLALLGIGALSHVAPFPFLFDALSGGVSVWRMPETGGRKVVYLTYDDGPNEGVTPELLDVLRELRVPATFFLIDNHIDGRTAPIVRRMFDEGHAVGLHSDDRWLMLKSPESLRARLDRAAGKIEAAGGRRPCPVFRPHAGWRSPLTFTGLARTGHRLVGWSWGTWDWCWFRKRTAPRIARQILARAAPGKIVVMHDGHHVDPRADRRYSVDATRLVVDGLRARGYGFALVCSR